MSASPTRVAQPHSENAVTPATFGAIHRELEDAELLTQYQILCSQRGTLEKSSAE